MRIDTDGVYGLVCLLKLMNGNIKNDGGNYQYWNRPKAGKRSLRRTSITRRCEARNIKVIQATPTQGYLHKAEHLYECNKANETLRS